MSQHFALMDENPNEGSGCLCSDTGTQESQGPYAVFNATEMDTVYSPFPVLCAGCINRAAQLLAEREESYAAPKPKAPKLRDRGRPNAEDGPSI